MSIMLKSINFCITLTYEKSHIFVSFEAVLKMARFIDMNSGSIFVGYQAYIMIKGGLQNVKLN